MQLDPNFWIETYVMDWEKNEGCQRSNTLLFAFISDLMIDKVVRREALENHDFTEWKTMKKDLGRI